MDGLPPIYAPDSIRQQQEEEARKFDTGEDWIEAATNLGSNIPKDDSRGKQNGLAYLSVSAKRSFHERRFLLGALIISLDAISNLLY